MIQRLGGERPAFLLHTEHSTYALRVTEAGFLEHLYYGARIAAESTDGLAEEHAFPPGNSCVCSPEESSFSLEDLRLEWSSLGKGDIREPAVEVVHADGSATSDFRYANYALGRGNLAFGGLPAACDDAETSEWLRIYLEDRQYGLSLRLTYRVFAACDVITRSASLKNNSGESVRVERLMSCCMDFDPGEYTLSTFGGAWAREMQRTDTPLDAGKHVNASVTGFSSSRANPFVMLWESPCGEESGQCWGLNLIYSGNHYACAEVSPYGTLRFVSGINPNGFSWLLDPGARFEAPEAVLCFSDQGFHGMSCAMHSFVREHIVRGEWKRRLRPVLLNSWEAAYFNISEARLLRLAKAARRVGIELFVVDDGWFGRRDDDTSSLGDWYPNPKKLPDGLTGLAEKILALGMEFGIWVEPEMVSENSALYRAHPDWVMRIPGKPHAEGRHQLVLDLCRSAVQDWMIETMSTLFSSAAISYVKWDCNRIFSDVYSPALPPERQGETAHRYILGLYRVLGTLMERFPHILFEGCAAGGNRFDLGALCYFPQIWASDNTDALCRAEIQTGYSYGYPPSVWSAHVSDVPNHQTLRRTDLETRFHVAAFGLLGYECNLCDFSPEELTAVKRQIVLYKYWRETLQFGEFFRARTLGQGGGGFSTLGRSPGNVVEWTSAAPGGERAVSLLLQALVHPNTQQAILHPRGLKPEGRYHLVGQLRDNDLRDYGGLINYVAPIHVRQDGTLHSVLAKAVRLSGEKEEHHMTGAAMMRAGVRLRPAFTGGGYTENLRLFPDFASRIYFIEEEGPLPRLSEGQGT